MAKTKVVKEVVDFKVETIAAPNAKTNSVIIKNFEEFAAHYKLNEKSTVNQIMLTVYENVGTNVHPAVLAQQIRDLTKGSTSQACISWYKNHYVPEQRCFKSSRKSNETEKQDLIAKIKSRKELESIFTLLPALSVNQLKSYANQLGL